jgi:hypothetical protein
MEKRLYAEVTYDDKKDNLTFKIPSAPTRAGEIYIKTANGEFIANKETGEKLRILFGSPDIPLPEGELKSKHENKDFIVSFNKDSTLSKLTIKNASSFISKRWNEKVPKKDLKNIEKDAEMIINYNSDGIVFVVIMGETGVINLQPSRDFV